MADRLTSRINTTRAEIDDSLDNGAYLHNIVVTNNTEENTFEFVCLAKDKRWESVRIGEDVLVGEYGRFSATVEHAIAIIRDAFSAPVYTEDGEAASPGVTLPTNEDLFAQSQAFFDTDPKDPQAPATGSIHLSPVTSQTGPTALPVAATATQQPGSLLTERKKGLLDRLAEKLEGAPATADPIDDLAPHPGGER